MRAGGRRAARRRIRADDRPRALRSPAGRTECPRGRAPTRGLSARGYGRNVSSGGLGSRGPPGRRRLLWGQIALLGCAAARHDLPDPFVDSLLSETRNGARALRRSCVRARFLGESDRLLLSRPHGTIRRGSGGNWPHSRSRSPLVRCLVALVAPSAHCALRPRLLAMGPACSAPYSSVAAAQARRLARVRSVARAGGRLSRPAPRHRPPQRRESREGRPTRRLRRRSRAERRDRS